MPRDDYRRARDRTIARRAAYEYASGQPPSFDHLWSEITPINQIRLFYSGTGPQEPPAKAFPLPQVGGEKARSSPVATMSRHSATRSAGSSPIATTPALGTRLPSRKRQLGLEPPKPLRPGQCPGGSPERRTVAEPTVADLMIQLASGKKRSRAAAAIALGRMGRDAAAAVPLLRELAYRKWRSLLAHAARDALRMIAEDDESRLARETEPVEPKPRWDAGTGRLTLGDRLLKLIDADDHGARAILDAFEELGWPRAIDDPLPGPRAGRCERLHQVVKALDADLMGIQFRVGITGERVVVLQRAPDHDTESPEG